MKRTSVFFVTFLFLITPLYFSSPLIGGFSLTQPISSLSVQPYDLYYYPGLAYEFTYSPKTWSVALGWSVSVPWMNFSQIPLSKQETPLALALAKAESNFQNYSRSHVGAEGLMQFMPSTAKAYGISNPFDPYQSVPAAMNYITQYEKRFSSLKLAIAAYNAGPGAVVKYKGIPPYAETRAYVSKVMKYVEEYSTVTSYPDIYARVGVFVKYSSTNKVAVGISYPLPPGEIDLCPELSFEGTSVSLSWVWRANVMGAHIALRHFPNADEIEISDTFGPLTAVVGKYQKGMAASGVLSLWNFKIFGSVSQWGDLRYGALFDVLGLRIEGWGSGEGYSLLAAGRW